LGQSYSGDVLVLVEGSAVVPFRVVDFMRFVALATDHLTLINLVSGNDQQLATERF
jgi:hypothetical protein